MSENYVEVAEQLNQEIYDWAVDHNLERVVDFLDDNVVVDLESSGYATAIKAFGFIIWCSEDDDREHNNASEFNYIPLKSHLKDKIVDLFKTIFQLSSIANYNNWSKVEVELTEDMINFDYTSWL